MSCSCDAAESAHHHAFGGTYPCKRVGCRGCRDVDREQWHDVSAQPTGRTQLGFDYIRRRYGARTDIPSKDPED